MIPRLLMGLGLLGSLAAPLGLAAWLAWDSARGRELWVPVVASYEGETRLIAGINELRRGSEGRPWLAIQVDDNHTALDVERTEQAPPPTPTTVVVSAPSGLPEAHRRPGGPDPAYAIYRVSPSGVAYLTGLADADRAPVPLGN